MSELKERIEAGGVVRLPAGRFRIDETITIKKTTVLHGDHRDLTFLDVDPGVTAFRLELGGQRSEICNLSIIGAGSSKATEPTFGIQSFVAPYLDRLNIRGFAQGVRIRANVHADGNANRIRCRDLQIQSCTHAAVYIDGPDANAGLFEGIAALNVCTRGDYWIGRDTRLRKEALDKAQAEALEAGREPPTSVPDPPGVMGTCGGMVASSFLGSEAWIACMVDKPIDLTTGRRFRAFVHEGDNSHSVFIATYSESALPSWISQCGIHVGGIGPWEGPGQHFDGALAAGFIIRNAQDPNNVTETKLGHMTRPGAFMGLFARAIDSSRGLEIDADILDPKTKALYPKENRRYRFRLAGQVWALLVEQCGKVWVRP
jgi:hypothetical protein